jgi:23S rRNA pseudouridine1911/1915/1917 synthase
MSPDVVVTATPGRLDAVLAGLTDAPRADVQRAIAAGGVLVDGVARAKSARLVGGELLEVTWSRTSEPAPEAGVEVPVRYRDDQLVVVAKPAGLITHPTPTRPAGTLVNRLLEMGIPLAPAGGPWRPGIVHRLDAGTSGLLVVACVDDAFRALQAMFRRHLVERRYLALVTGDPSHETFTVDAPLGRRADRVVVDRSEGRRASTSFEVAERFDGASLVAATPATGRTHQIRVHLSAVGHPIVGDRAYGGAGDLARALGVTRPMLHAAGIAFEHPGSAARVELTEPTPADMADAIDRARLDLRP